MKPAAATPTAATSCVRREVTSTMSTTASSSSRRMSCGVSTGAPRGRSRRPRRRRAPAIFVPPMSIPTLSTCSLSPAVRDGALQSIARWSARRSRPRRDAGLVTRITTSPCVVRPVPKELPWNNSKSLPSSPPIPQANVTDLLVERVQATPGLGAVRRARRRRRLARHHGRRVPRARSSPSRRASSRPASQPGDKIGFIAARPYEWTLVDFAPVLAGAVMVPIYETSSPPRSPGT